MDYKLNIEPFTWVYVVGESFHIAEIDSLGLISHKKFEDGKSIETTFEIVPEPDNPYSSSGMALSVRKNGKVLGYLADDTDDTVRNALARIAASGMTATTTGTLWTLKARDGLKASIKIRLPRKFTPESLTGDNLVPLADSYQVPNAYKSTSTSKPKINQRDTKTFKVLFWILKLLAKIFLVLIVAALLQGITGSAVVAGFTMLIGAGWILFGRLIRKLIKK